MNWLNIELSILRSTEYLGSDPIQRATWINLMAYCADQENGGIIKDCSEWGDRKWMQLVGISKSESNEQCDLWKIESTDLHVWNYPKNKEIEVKAKREAGKKGGRPPKIKADKPDGSVLLKRKGKERKGKERNVREKEKETTPLPPIDPQAKSIHPKYESEPRLIYGWFISQDDRLNEMVYPYESFLRQRQTYPNAGSWLAAPKIIVMLAGIADIKKRSAVGLISTLWGKIDLQEFRDNKKYKGKICNTTKD